RLYVCFLLGVELDCDNCCKALSSMRQAWTDTRPSPAPWRPILPTYTQTRHMLRILATIFAALLGLAFGSFLNVCLSRWPRDESIVHPRSHCRTCGRTLTWWENIPLLSWVMLRGRC